LRFIDSIDKQDLQLSIGQSFYFKQITSSIVRMINQIEEIIGRFQTIIISLECV
jgi:hypothetical protein